jgi:hypothetical protein
MSSPTPIITVPPKSGNKVTRWFKTRTGQTVVGVIAGAVALKIPGGQEVVQAVLGANAPSDPGSFANGMSIAAILAGIARMRSA